MLRLKSKTMSKKATRLERRVMFVEDDVILHPLLRDFLPNCRVLLAANGEKALNIIKKEKTKVDLVVCDYHMPGWNGVETIKQLRKISPNTRFVLMSGSEPNRLSILALEAEADAWLNKPFSEEILLKKMEIIFKKEHAGN